MPKPTKKGNARLIIIGVRETNAQVDDVVAASSSTGNSCDPGTREPDRTLEDPEALVLSPPEEDASGVADEGEE